MKVNVVCRKFEWREDIHYKPQPGMLLQCIRVWMQGTLELKGGGGRLYSHHPPRTLFGPFAIGCGTTDLYIISI